VFVRQKSISIFIIITSIIFLRFIFFQTVEPFALMPSAEVDMMANMMARQPCTYINSQSCIYATNAVITTSFAMASCSRLATVSIFSRVSLSRMLPKIFCKIGVLVHRKVRLAKTRTLTSSSTTLPSRTSRQVHRII
jgi:hypothetical protein